MFRRVRGLTLLYRQVFSLPKSYQDRILYRHAPLVSLAAYSLYTAVTVYLFLYSRESTGKSDDYTHVILRRLLSSEENNTASNNTSTQHTGLPWEQCDFELSSNYSAGWVVHHLWWIFFCFIGLAVVCDDFFVPALEIISEKLKLSEDVAGATFMAAGSSAPELFTSLMGVAQETDVGVGAIVGSAVFNILVIISLTGALAGQVLQLDWRPLVRDITFYAISIIVFLAVSFDGQITWYEASLLLLLYVLYIVAMVFNPKIMALLNRPCCCRPSETEPDTEMAAEESGIKSFEHDTGEDNEEVLPAVTVHHRRVSFQKSSFSGGHARRLSLHHQLHSGRGHPSLGHIWEGNHPESLQAHRSSRKDSGFSDDTVRVSNEDANNAKSSSSIGNNLDLPIKCKNSATTGDTIAEEGDIAESKEDISNDVALPVPAVTLKEEQEVSEDGDDDEIVVCSASCCPRIKSTPPTVPVSRSCCKMVVFGLKWCLYVIAFPYYFLCTFTIPDCSKDQNRKWFIATFFLSILWILALSFAMVTLVTRTGCIVGIDEFVMGLVIVAIGTSVPDCLSSILVARDGFGDMAVSNAIGSNVFDIDLGLGFPFLLRILIEAGQPMVLLDESDQKLKEDGLLKLIPHVKFAIILLALLFVIFLLFLVSKFRLNKMISVSFVLLYVLFIVYALIQQLVCQKYMC